MLTLPLRKHHHIPLQYQGRVINNLNLTAIPLVRKVDVKTNKRGEGWHTHTPRVTGRSRATSSGSTRYLFGKLSYLPQGSCPLTLLARTDGAFPLKSPPGFCNRSLEAGERTDSPQFPEGRPRRLPRSPPPRETTASGPGRAGPAGLSRRGCGLRRSSPAPPWCQGTAAPKRGSPRSRPRRGRPLGPAELLRGALPSAQPPSRFPRLTAGPPHPGLLSRSVERPGPLGPFQRPARRPRRWWCWRRWCWRWRRPRSLPGSERGRRTLRASIVLSPPPQERRPRRRGNAHAPQHRPQTGRPALAQPGAGGAAHACAGSHRQGGNACAAAGGHRCACAAAGRVALDSAFQSVVAFNSS